MDFHTPVQLCVYTHSLIGIYECFLKLMVIQQKINILHLICVLKK